MRHVTGLWRQVTIIICVKWWTKITSEPVATFILPEKFRISTLKKRYCFSLVPHSYKHPKVEARAEHRSCYSAFVTCVFIPWSHSGENCAPGCGALVVVCKHRGWNAAHLGGHLSASPTLSLLDTPLCYLSISLPAWSYTSTWEPFLVSQDKIVTCSVYLCTKRHHFFSDFLQILRWVLA